jgi:Na+/H+-dicarboxylate symporter
MKVIMNMAVWLAVASILGSIVGLIANFAAGDHPSIFMDTIVQVWAQKGWLLPYMAVGVLVCTGIYSVNYMKTRNAN